MPYRLAADLTHVFYCLLVCAHSPTIFPSTPRRGDVRTVWSSIRPRRINARGVPSCKPTRPNRAASQSSNLNPERAKAPCGQAGAEILICERHVSQYILFASGLERIDPRVRRRLLLPRRAGFANLPMEACGRIAAVLVVGVAGETAGCWEFRAKLC
jgi:hypothetical protein